MVPPMRSMCVAAAVLGCSSPAVPDLPDASEHVDVIADARPDGAHLVVDDPCFPEPGAGHRVYACNGITFDIEVPVACMSGGCGLILDVHGLTMSGPMEEANSELRVRGGAAGFVVIQPSANPSPPQSSWGDSDE